MPIPAPKLTDHHWKPILSPQFLPYQMYGNYLEPISFHFKPFFVAIFKQTNPIYILRVFVIDLLVNQFQCWEHQYKMHHLEYPHKTNLKLTLC